MHWETKETIVFYLKLVALWLVSSVLITILVVVLGLPPEAGGPIAFFAIFLPGVLR